MRPGPKRGTFRVSRECPGNWVLGLAVAEGRPGKVVGGFGRCFYFGLQIRKRESSMGLHFVTTVITYNIYLNQALEFE